MPVGSSSSGAYGCTGYPTHRSTLPPNLRLRPSPSNQLVVLVLAISGANLFSDGLLPPLRFQKRRVQKNETHPRYSMNIRTVAATLSLPQEALLFDLDVLYSCLAGGSARETLWAGLASLLLIAVLAK